MNRPISEPSEIKYARNYLCKFDSKASITFFVGKKSGKSLRLFKINIDEKVASSFRKIARSVIDGGQSPRGLLKRESEEWSPEAQITPETYLECAVGVVGDDPHITKKKNISPNSGNENFLSLIQYPETFELLDPKEIKPENLAIYGFTIGDSGDRIAFVRKLNPRRGLSSGKWFGFFSDTMNRIDEPIFAFDNEIDLICVADRLVILKQNAFYALFRSNEGLYGLVEKWVQNLESEIKCGIEEESLKKIKDKANSDSRIRQRLEAITQRGHLGELSVDQIKNAMEDCALEEEDYFDSDGLLKVSDENIEELLYFLNEDLYSGRISGEAFRADKKAKL